ncbi:MAG: hypothetical protein LBF04_02690 [Prevotellaceae bacterium]|jgi:hypothetical protein|nr:hypothetical protein [Prevotellaceae bacterium]
MQKTLIQLTKVIIFALLITSCAKRATLCPMAGCSTESKPTARSQKSNITEYSSETTKKVSRQPLATSQRQDSYQSINNRSALKKEQRMREKNTRYWAKQDQKEAKADAKLKKKEEKEYQKYLKKERKRHLKWQDDDVRKRIKKNEKLAHKAMNKKAK